MIAAVPGASLVKSNSIVSQSKAVVVIVSVSTLIVGSVASSTFRRTAIPASGDQTLTVILVLPSAKGIASVSPALLAVVPAHVSAKSGLLVCTTVLPGSEGSMTKPEALPPKSAKS